MSVVLQFLRVIAACTSVCMLLSPSPMVYKMYKTKDTGVMSIVPLVAVLVNSNMWMMYGFMDENYVPVFATFVVGDLVSLAYVIIYYRYSRDRTSNHKVLAIAALIIAVTSTYVIIAGLGYTGQTRHQVATLTGVVAAVTGMLMYSSPLVKIIHVFRYKSGAFIPIHMVCAGSGNNIVWITYSILAKKWVITIPASGAFAIGAFQMILYFFVYHPSTHPLPDELKTVETHKDQDLLVSVVVQSPLRGQEKQGGSFAAIQSPI